MKHSLLSVLLAGLAWGCRRHEEPMPDLLLGRWQAERTFFELRTAAGQRYARYNFRPDTITLDVTATTLTFTRRTGTVQLDYTRVGEAITLPQYPSLLQYARELTANSFTYNGQLGASPDYLTSYGYDFHR